MHRSWYQISWKTCSSAVAPLGLNAVSRRASCPCAGRYARSHRHQDASAAFVHGESPAAGSQFFLGTPFGCANHVYFSLLTETRSVVRCSMRGVNAPAFRTLSTIFHRRGQQCREYPQLTGPITRIDTAWVTGYSFFFMSGRSTPSTRGGPPAPSPLHVHELTVSNICLQTSKVYVLPANNQVFSKTTHVLCAEVANAPRPCLQHVPRIPPPFTSDTFTSDTNTHNQPLPSRESLRWASNSATAVVSIYKTCY